MPFTTAPTEVLVDGTWFMFPADWRTEVFDELPQYKKATQLGLEGCDVVALDGLDLWLIEMKDYTYPGAHQPDDLANTVGRKAAGTMALLYALARATSDSPARDLAVVCSAANRIHLALHIDIKDAGRGAKQVQPVLMPLQDKLRRAQKALGIHKAYVTSTLAPNSATPWTARREPTTRSLHEDR
ncbi:hypothetical protein [Myceligenerans crystallogenes]|uniref:Uncharacterized protein n=1 Tax=Myceligenerans crystallogenes TaxID=316335 RepID=A0ABN2NLC7_9MICO